MSLEKIEQLVERINHAIKTIQVLKDEKTRLVQEANMLRGQIEKLKADNSRLNAEKNELLSDKNESLKLHRILEEKIEEILDSLPEDDIQDFENPVDVPPKTKQLNKAPQKQQPEPGQKVKENVNEAKNLFAIDYNNNDKVDAAPEEMPIGAASIDLNEDSNNKDFGEDIKINFEETLVNESEEKEINFYINNKSNINDDLPKGVL